MFSRLVRYDFWAFRRYREFRFPCTTITTYRGYTQNILHFAFQVKNKIGQVMYTICEGISVQKCNSPSSSNVPGTPVPKFVIGYAGVWNFPRIVIVLPKIEIYFQVSTDSCKPLGDRFIFARTRARAISIYSTFYYRPGFYLPTLPAGNY